MNASARAVVPDSKSRVDNAMRVASEFVIDFPLLTFCQLIVFFRTSLPPMTKKVTANILAPQSAFIVNDILAI